MLIAIDIGGTKVQVAKVTMAKGASGAAGPELRIVEVSRHESDDFPDLAALVRQRLGADRAEAVAIGIAGPVLGRRVRLTNLSWEIDADQLERALGCPVALMNDLEAHGWGIAQADGQGLVTLQAGRPRPGNRALIAAGTGLGEAILCWNGHEHVPSASEGGHASFAPSNPDELELLRFLWGRYEHVSWERVVSGIDGFRNLVDFFLATGRIQLPPAQAAALTEARDVGPLISQAAAAGEPHGRLVLEWFVRLYGAEAGNLALKAMATGGLYIAGGIAPKILPWLQGGLFTRAMVGKGRFRDFLSEIPVHVVVDEHLALKGAAVVAARLTRS